MWSVNYWCRRGRGCGLSPYHVSKFTHARLNMKCFLTHRWSLGRLSFIQMRGNDVMKTCRAGTSVISNAAAGSEIDAVWIAREWRHDGKWNEMNRHARYLFRVKSVCRSYCTPWQISEWHWVDYSASFRKSDICEPYVISLILLSRVKCIHVKSGVKCVIQCISLSEI